MTRDPRSNPSPHEAARERISWRLTAYAANNPELKREPQAGLITIARDRERHWSERTVAIGIVTLGAPPPGWPAVLQAIVRDEADQDYVRLDAALALALLGQRDAGAIAVLRRVITPGSYFAVTQSCMERGAASLGLGLMGDEAARPLVQGVAMLPINGNGIDASVALRLLDAAKR